MAGPDSEPTGDGGAYSIRAVQRVCDLLDALQQEPDGLSLVRAAEVTGLPKSSAFRYLATLEQRRYVERDEPTGGFRLGLAFLPLQARQLDVVTQRTRPHLEALQREFGETANLGLLDGGQVSYLDIVESPQAMRFAARRGDRDPLHSTALGKVLAAQLPPDQVRAIVKAEGMPRRTPATITSQRDLLAELERVRQAGYAVDDGENEVGARCVAVAVPGVSMPIAISVAGPAARLTEERVPAVAARMQDIAESIGGELSGAPTRP